MPFYHDTFEVSIATDLWQMRKCHNRRSISSYMSISAGTQSSLSMLSRCHLKSEAPLTEKIAQNANIETTTADPTTRKFLARAIPINADRSARGKTNPYCQGESMQQTTISFAAKRNLAALALDTGRNPSSEAPQILQPTCQAKGNAIALKARRSTKTPKFASTRKKHGQCNGTAID